MPVPSFTCAMRARPERSPVVRQVIKVGQFPFPTQSKLVPRYYGPQKAALSPRRKPRKGGARLWLRPDFPHMGLVETQGHRCTRTGRWIKARGWVGKPKVKAGTPARGMLRKYGWTHPYARLRQWYIWEGDQVRVTVGKPEIKYNDPEVGVKSGWKVYTVSTVNMHKNRVYLKELEGKRSNTTPPRPDDFDSWPQERQERWTMVNEISPTTKAVQVSNLSLLIKQAYDPKDHVWSKRIKTSAAKWLSKRKQWVWQRYAIPDRNPDKVEGEWHKLVRDRDRSKQSRWFPIEYPEGRERDLSKSNIEYEMDVEDHSVASKDIEPVTTQQITATLGDISVLDFVPKMLTSGPPKHQAIADLYRLGKADETARASVDTLMPLYLSEELSPRYANYTTKELIEARSVLRFKEKKQYIENAVREWQLRGRDRHLREVMDTDQADLRGVVLRPRSESEVREVAEIEWQQETRAKLKNVAWKFKMGWKWDYSTREGGWFRGPKAERREQKRSGRIAKKQRQEVMLSELTLRPAKNQFVPQEASRPALPVKVKTKKKKGKKPLVRPGDVFAKYLRTNSTPH